MIKTKKERIWHDFYCFKIFFLPYNQCMKYVTNNFYSFIIIIYSPTAIHFLARVTIPLKEFWMNSRSKLFMLPWVVVPIDRDFGVVLQEAHSRFITQNTNDVVKLLHRLIMSFFFPNLFFINSRLVFMRCCYENHFLKGVLYHEIFSPGI